MSSVKDFQVFADGVKEFVDAVETHEFSPKGEAVKKEVYKLLYQMTQQIGAYFMSKKVADELTETMEDLTGDKSMEGMIRKMCFDAAKDALIEGK